MSYLNRQNIRFCTEHINSGLEAWGALRNSADSGVRWQRCGWSRLSSAMGPETSPFLSLDLVFHLQLVENEDYLIRESWGLPVYFNSFVILALRQRRDTTSGINLRK